jgi:hypothetical protein
MFKSEHHSTRNVADSTKNGVSIRGTRLVETDDVNRGNFSYRVLTLSLGIVVALILGFTFLAARSSWFADGSAAIVPSWVGSLVDEIGQRATSVREVLWMYF